MPKLKDKPQDSEDDLAAVMFRALGDATRLRIFNLLRSRATLEAAVAQLEAATDVGKAAEIGVAPPPGPPTSKEGKGSKNKKTVSPASVPVGEICLHITGEKKFTSAISHHLKELRHAGLITVERCGKQKLCHINEQAVEALSAYIALRPE